MDEVEQILAACQNVLVIDWPSPDVPETLARVGFTVHVKGGPGPDDYSMREMRDGVCVSHKSGRRPARADLLYVHRPLDEIESVIDGARGLGACVLWYQSGLLRDGRRDPRGCWLPAAESRRVRALVEAAGLRYVDDRYIADAARELATGH